MEIGPRKYEGKEWEVIQENGIRRGLPNDSVKVKGREHDTSNRKGPLTT